MIHASKLALAISLGIAFLFAAGVIWQYFNVSSYPSSISSVLTTNGSERTDSDLPRIALTTYTRGGLCPYGACNETFTLYASGQYRITRTEADRAEVRVLRSGALPSETSTRLFGLIESTDFDGLRQQPFDDLCPVAFDGSEMTYTFILENGKQEVLDTCQHVLDYDQPLLRDVRSLPTSGQ